MKKEENAEKVEEAEEDALDGKLSELLPIAISIAKNQQFWS